MSKVSATLMAALAFVILGSQSNASFYLSVKPSAQPAPAGRTALDLFAQNDLDPVDGVNILAASIVFSGSNGTRVFFATQPNFDTGTPEVDVFNFNDNGSALLDASSSNFRIGAQSRSDHVFPLYPHTLASNEIANGLSSFQVEYALLGASNTAPGSVYPGARVARLVFNSSTPSFTINARFAGEVGPIGGGLIPAAPLTVLAPEPASLTLIGAAASVAVRRRRR